MSLTRDQKQILHKHLLLSLVKHDIVKAKDAGKLIRQETEMFSSAERNNLLEELKKETKESKQEKIALTWRPDKSKKKNYLTTLSKIRSFTTLQDAQALAAETYCITFYESLPLIGEVFTVGRRFIQETCIITAFKSGNKEQLDHMLEHKLLDVNLKSADGSSLLDWSISTENRFAFDYLLAHSVNINQMSNNITPIAKAYGKTKDAKHHFVESLLEKKADLNLIILKKGTILHLAAHYDDSIALEKFVKAGANTEIVDHGNNTALAFAVFENRFCAAATLLKLGANIDAAHSDGSTMLNWLITFEKPSPEWRLKTFNSAQFLMENQFNPHHKDVRLDYVHQAFAFDRLDILGLLIKHKANIKRTLNKAFKPLANQIKLIRAFWLDFNPSIFEVACLSLQYEAVKLLGDSGQVDFNQVISIKYMDKTLQCSLMLLLDVTDDKDLSPEKLTAKENIKKYLISKSSQLAENKDENARIQQLFKERKLELEQEAKRLEEQLATFSQIHTLMKSLMKSNEQDKIEMDEKRRIEQTLLEFKALKSQAIQNHEHIPNRFMLTDELLLSQDADAIKTLTLALEEWIQNHKLRQLANTETTEFVDSKDKVPPAPEVKKDEASYAGIPLSQLNCIYSLRGEDHHKLWFDPQQIKDIQHMDQKEVEAVRHKLTELRLVAPEGEQGIVTTGENPPVCEAMINGKLFEGKITSKIKLFSIDGKRNARRILLMELDPDQTKSHAPKLLLAVVCLSTGDHERPLANKYKVTLTLSAKKSSETEAKAEPKLKITIPGTLYIPGNSHANGLSLTDSAALQSPNPPR